MLKILFVFVFIISCQHPKSVVSHSDQFQWLEEIKGEQSLQWVKEQNAETFKRLKDDRRFKEVQTTVADILNDKERIPFGSIHGEFVYNVWTDQKNIRGLVRRSKLKSYLTGRPKWETVLDIDQLSSAEKESWVFKGFSSYSPDNKRALLSLSRGGKDAIVLREFDLMKKKFVDGGFYLPEAKITATWYDQDTLVAGSAADPLGKTDSGYPRAMRLWKRGTKFEDAPVLIEVEQKDVRAWAYRDHERKDDLLLTIRMISFYENEFTVRLNNRVVKLDLPRDVDFQGVFKDALIISLRSDWEVDGKDFKMGSLLSIDLAKMVSKGLIQPQEIFTPNNEMAIQDVAIAKDKLLVSLLHHVNSELWQFSFNGEQWIKNKIALPSFGAISINFSSDYSNGVFLSYANFLVPPTLYYYQVDTGSLKTVMGLSAKFESAQFQVNQYFTKSRDGERIPYFVISNKELKLDGKNPTLLYGYGGFEVSILPSYQVTNGKLWLNKGGVYVLANIRGGGEYGPRWHQAVKKHNRQKAFEDFIAVAEDLIARKITSPDKLAISGGSNGGLLVGSVITQRPDLFKAAVCSVPLLDMLRYHQLLAGASWMAEYGNPDIPEDRDVLKRYSPYHQIESSKKYPEVFFRTSTMDDRVHPGHARKMVAKLKSVNHSVLYYENTEGGHGGAADWKQRAQWTALEYIYLYQKLMD